MSTSPTFPLLADPSNYRACDLNLSTHGDRLAYWVNLYRTHFPGLLEEAVAVEVHDGRPREEAKAQAIAARKCFFDYLDALAPAPASRLDILTIGERRERILRQHGFADPYRLVKERENAAALLALPKLLAELDAMPVAAADDRARRELVLIQGVFAGNIFDVGAAATLAMFKAGQIDFHKVRARLKPRPWRIDGFDAWIERLATRPPHRAAVLFVDNAGCDIALGMIPFARSLLQRGTRVIVAANTTPSLNDITAPELKAMLESIATWDAVIGRAWAAGEIEVIASGCGTPLIDLSRVSKELVDGVMRLSVDLVVLEGMGRAVESNLHAKFTCEVMNLALVKDPDVAKHIGGEMYDQAMRYERP
jgi:type II pantothenate kinase